MKKWLHTLGKVEEVEIESECNYLFKVKGKGSWSKKASFDVGFYNIESDALQAALVYMQLKSNEAKHALAKIEDATDELNSRLANS